MSTSIFKNSDLIKNLPVDEEELSLKEKTILDTLYPSDNTTDTTNTTNTTNDKTDSVKQENLKKNAENITKNAEKTWFHFKDIILATILFFLINLPYTEKLLEKVVKTDNLYYKLAYKSVIFAVLFFAINNFYLSRR